MRRDRGVVCGCVLRRTVDETKRSVKPRGGGNEEKRIVVLTGRLESLPSCF